MTGSEIGDQGTAWERARAAQAAYAVDSTPANLASCIVAYQALIESLDPNAESADHGVAAIDYCNLLGQRWVATRSQDEWNEAIAFIEFWRRNIPPPDWRSELYILAHGVLLYRRADATETSDDIAEAIRTLEHARSRVRAGSGIACTSSTYLANLRLRRFRATGQPADLESATRDALAVLMFERAREEESASAAKTLCAAALGRAELLPSAETLDIAVDLAKDALTRVSDETDRADVQGVLAAALRQRFELTRQRGDLDAAIDGYKAALDAPLLRPEVTASRTDDLGNGFASRYELSHDSADLERAIECSRRALTLFPADAAQRARTHANLGISLIHRGCERKDPELLEEAAEICMTGLSVHDLGTDIAARLQFTLARALLLIDIYRGEATRLDQAIDAAEAALVAALQGESDDPVRYRLAARHRASHVTRLLVAALLDRSLQDTASAAADLKRALAVGEAGKVVLLTQEVLRRSLSAPEDVDASLLAGEAELLARLAAFDALDMASVDNTYERTVRRARARTEIRAALENLWDQIARIGPEANKYVLFRRDLSAGLLDVLVSARDGMMLVSILETLELERDGSQSVGVCMLAWLPDEVNPWLVSRLSKQPLSIARERFTKEIPEDHGQQLLPETWWEDVAELAGQKPQLGDFELVVSGIGDGLYLPWNLVFERAGWTKRDGTPLPVISVPSLALITASGRNGHAVHEVLDVAEHLGMTADDQIVEGIRAFMRLDGAPSEPPVVVGDPTADLKFASREAGAIAEILGVKPLEREQATIAAVTEGLREARIVHIAAHARFDSADPLASVVRLADGDLPARVLVGGWNTSELVVLSACESGLGANAVGGEVLGLSTELLRSGVRTVVASLWCVDDRATNYLMKCFYRAIIRGVDPPIALTDAMSAVREQPGWNAPYYWAGFVISQRGGRPVD